ncbi:hypothetical protein FB45DRAFT_904839 [Roridomyces roridus]|uniref:RING-type domain-containing protein n=1 Tax=Roridomyces roridus TaxID=1738132 RepID=A0AAD7C592_9AGAR|nr:hypothetical protein FB45DRAFT_904839 [Roridomyces roridus]
MGLDKGKKRARDETPLATTSSGMSSPLSSLSPPPDEEREIVVVDPGPAKKYRKRAETRECPVCSEQIPVRLLAAHAELEAERVQAIMRRVGETDVDFELLDSLELIADSEAPTRPRLRARKFIGSTSNSRGVDAAAALLTESANAITAIKRHRKQRHAKLKELVREGEEGSSSRVRETWRSRRGGAGEVVCPVCLVTVRGDEDVIEAHVDACLRDQTRRLEESRQAAIVEQRQRRRERALDMELEEAGPGHVGNVQGTGFATRDPNALDVDDEIDIDGDDDFGEAQFTEGDVVSFPATQHLRAGDEDMDVDVEDDEETLRELVAQGKVIKREKTEQQVVETTAAVVDESDKLELAILAAKNRGDQASLVDLLQSKIQILESRSAPSLCRICIEAYTDPTVSTGCWHTCCKECWLRCLGSTKLCPICKRITAATDLRKVYL